MSKHTVHYTAAGGVVVHHQKVLVLNRPGRNEVRLPKGHIEPDEDPPTTAIREVAEESGYVNLEVVTDLGTQIVEFDLEGKHVTRTEHYFLMVLTDEEKSGGEDQFEPLWLPWGEALSQLTFPAEREWVRRAHKHAG